MVTTDDSSLAASLRRFRSHGIANDARQRQASGQWYYEMVDLGFNYRLTDIASALGLSQLKKLDPNLARRREIATRYQEAFGKFPELTIPAVRENANPAWHLYPIRLNLEKLATNRTQIFRALRAENIGVNVHYIPVHLHPYYRKEFGYQGAEYPIAENAYERLISLPMRESTPALDARLRAEQCEVVALQGAVGTSEDAENTAAIARECGAQWLVVDGYGFGADYQRTLKQNGCRVLWMDDNGHGIRNESKRLPAGSQDRHPCF